MWIDELQFFQAVELREGRQHTKISGGSVVELVIVEVLAEALMTDVVVKAAAAAVSNDDVVMPAIAALIMVAGVDSEPDVLCHQNVMGNTTTFGEPMAQQLQDRDEHANDSLDEKPDEKLDEKSADWFEWSADDTSESWSVAVEAVI